MLNQKGQGLIEYLILVALMAVATIGVVTILNSTVNSKFVQVIDALQGREKATKTNMQRTKDSDTKKRNMSDFMRGSAHGR